MVDPQVQDWLYNTPEEQRLQLMRDNRNVGLLRAQYELLKMRHNTLKRDIMLLEKKNIDLECINEELQTKANACKNSYETWYARFDEIWKIVWDLFREAPEAKQQEIMKKYGEDWKWYH